MNIVLVAEHFAPLNTIAAVRITKLAKYLKLNSMYNITVISRKLHELDVIDPTLSADLKYVDNHITLDYPPVIRILMSIRKNLYQAKLAKAKQTISHNISIKPSKSLLYKELLSSLIIYILNTFEFIATTGYAKAAVKYIKKKFTHPCDVIISSYGPYSSHIIGGILKKRNPNSLWIADFRDPVEAPTPSKKCITYRNKYISNASQNADIVTGVAKSCLRYFSEDFEDKYHLICNGFDRDDLKGLNAEKSSMFTLTYTGMLYQGKSDLSTAFRVLNELINEDRIDKNKIHVNYAGISETDFRQQISRYNLSEITSFHGVVNRRRSLELQLGSSMLLLASWNSVGETGEVTGKFLEYLMINRPIVCTITGNLANSYLKELITMANNGVVWEEANDEKDYLVLKAYILDQYERFMRNEPLLFEPDMAFIAQYNYENITQQFVDLIEENKVDKSV